MSSLKSIKGVDFIFTLGVLFVASSTIHEYGHLFTLRLLGGKGIIDSGVLNGVQLIESCGYQHGNIFVAFMGGYLSSLIFLALWLLSEDPETKVARFSIITYQFIYGSFEGLWYATGSDVLLMVGVLLGIGLMFITMIIALLRRGVVFRFITRQSDDNNISSETPVDVN